MPPDKPHYPLADIQAQMNCVAELVMTRSAQESMISLGYSKRDVVRIVQALSASDFYKSMLSTTHPWCHQDVYRPTHADTELYLKVSQDPDVDEPKVGDYMLISFKDSDRGS